MPEDQNRDYNDVYPTCAKTYSTLRIFSETLGPEVITTTLIIQPTDTFRKCESHTLGRLHRKANGWFFSTEHSSNSYNSFIRIQEFNPGGYGIIDNFLIHQVMRIGFTGNLWLVRNAKHLT